MYCSKCGSEIDNKAVVCPKCGVPTENFSKRDEPNIVINNTNTNANTNNNVNINANQRLCDRNKKNKWVAFFLCLFLGYFGAHKFYERKYLLGIAYIFTLGFLFFGWLTDLVKLFFKPNPYYV